MIRSTWSGGHGLGSRTPGKVDPGAVGFGLTEANIAMGMARRLGNDTAALGWDTLIRDTGPYYKADDDAVAFRSRLFSEVHCNAATSPAATGVEVCVGEGATEQTYKLARTIGRGIALASGLPNRGVKVRRDLAVLRKHIGMDSILIELFMLSNAVDLAKYQRNVDRVELGILNAVLWSYGYVPVPSLPRKWGKTRSSWGKLLYR